jgi:hypothetical protein
MVKSVRRMLHKQTNKQTNKQTSRLFAPEMQQADAVVFTRVAM